MPSPCFSFGLFACLVPEVRLRRAVCRAWMLLKEIYGYDVPEIARMMDTTERNVYYFTWEGKRLAREEWKREEEEAH